MDSNINPDLRATTQTITDPLERGIVELKSNGDMVSINQIFFQIFDKESRDRVLDNMVANATSENSRRIAGLKMATQFDSTFFNLPLPYAIIADEYRKNITKILLSDKPADYCFTMLSLASTIEDTVTLSRFTNALNERSGNISRGIIKQQIPDSPFQRVKEDPRLDSFFSEKNVGSTFEHLKYLLYNFNTYASEMQEEIVRLTYAIMGILTQEKVLFGKPGSLKRETVEEISSLIKANSSFEPSTSEDFKSKMKEYYPTIF